MPGHNCSVCSRETWHRCKSVGCGKYICQLHSLSYPEEDDENKRHCLSHESEKSVERFICPNCDKSYAARKNLDFHIKSQHPTEPVLRQGAAKLLSRAQLRAERTLADKADVPVPQRATTTRPLEQRAAKTLADKTEVPVQQRATTTLPLEQRATTTLPLEPSATTTLPLEQRAARTLANKNEVPDQQRATTTLPLEQRAARTLADKAEVPVQVNSTG